MVSTLQGLFKDAGDDLYQYLQTKLDNHLGEPPKGEEARPPLP